MPINSVINIRMRQPVAAVSPSPGPLVYVIVLSWNQRVLTSECIDSLVNIPDSNVKILVIDNDSQDGTVLYLRENFGDRIQIIEAGRNLGFAAGNNIGIQFALAHSAEYIMILNNDTRVSPDFLTPLLARLKKEPLAGAVTPKIYYMHDGKTIWAAGGKINFWLGKVGSRGKGGKDNGQYQEAEIVDYTTGCCFLAPRATFETVGFFNEPYFAYFEDTDWSMRVKKAGLEIWYEPGSCIWHVAGASSKNNSSAKHGKRSPFLIYLLARNNLWFIRSHIFGIRKLSAIAFFLLNYVVVYTVAYILLKRWDKLRNLWKGVIDGFYRLA